MEVLILFFILHWYGSVFVQTVYLHRYSAHRMFSMSPQMEKLFHWATFLFQGSSYLNPRAYAIMHQHHHQFSDTVKDPHSPHFHRNAFKMMLYTADYYQELVESKDPKHHKDYVKHEFLDWLGGLWVTRLAWGVAYTSLYLVYAPTWHWLLLLPAHFLMGPIHGAIVNWCGHKYGYRNYDSKDKSVNTLLMDLLIMGELYQNNHHQRPKHPNLAHKWWEFDPAYPILLCLHGLGIVKLKVKDHFKVDVLIRDLQQATGQKWQELQVKFHNNQKLAHKLCQTKNALAQCFAASIVDMKRLSSERLDVWAKQISDLEVRRIFVERMAAKTPLAYVKAKSWTEAKREKLRLCGYELLTALSQKKSDLSHGEWAKHLEQISRDFKSSSQNLRASMQNTYANISRRNDELKQIAYEYASGNQALLVAIAA